MKQRMFSDKNSRPNISIRRYVSALILKRMYRLSDETLLEFLRCGAMNFQYALHTTQDKKQPLSENSLRRFRRRVEKYNKENKCDLIRDEYLRISRKLAMDMGILHLDPDKGETEETKTMYFSVFWKNRRRKIKMEMSLRRITAVSRQTACRIHLTQQRLTGSKRDSIMGS